MSAHSTDTGKSNMGNIQGNFARKAWISVGIVTAVVVTLLLSWWARDILLALFAGILLAVFLNGAARLLGRYTPLSRRAALFVVLLVLLALLLVAGWLLEPNLVRQSTRLGEELRASWNSLDQQLNDSATGRWLLSQTPELQSLGSNTPAIFSRVTNLFSATINSVTKIAIVFFTGIYLAYEPQVYKNGILKLAPQNKRARLDQVLDEMGYSLRWWLVGQFISMTIIGVLSAAGLMLIGMPLAIALGLLAGLLQFIPVLGPALAFIPPVLIALSIEPQMAVYVILLYLGVQIVESYFITPMIQRRVASLPPVVLIASQLLFGLFAGVLGIMLAAPLAVVVMVGVKMLYVEDILDDHSVETLSEERGTGQSLFAAFKERLQKAM